MIVNVLLWCLFGLIAGAIAQFVMPGKDPGQSASPTGFLITIALGVLGALVGGFLSSNLFGWDVTGFNLASFAVAVGGALLLLVLYRLIAPTAAHRR
ncbi:MAG: GlsB/YeaQ/YmgE family stress response membrane protein [Planctomycetota bacterium]